MRMDPYVEESVICILKLVPAQVAMMSCADFSECLISRS